MASKTVLVIGGGLAGITAIVGFRKLDKTTKVVLVEPKDHMEVFWSAYRTPFEDWVAKGALKSLDDGYCAKNSIEHVHQVVTKLTDGEATLDNGETIKFDACVVAVGAASKWPAMGRGVPTNDGSSEARLKSAKEAGKDLLGAGSVLVVGGGLIGTELAGDLASYSKQAGKKLEVTLVHSGDHLCPEMVGNKAPTVVKQQLEKNGVRVVLGERAVESDDGKWTLQKSGEVIEAERVVMTIGLQPVTGFMKEGGLESSLTEKGWIDTDDFFKVKGTSRLFSFGDTSTVLPNSGSQLLANKAIIGHNIKAAVDGKSALKKFKLGPTIYLATTGTKTGVMYGGKGFWTKRIFPGIKNKTMFYFRPKSELGF